LLQAIKKTEKDASERKADEKMFVKVAPLLVREILAPDQKSRLVTKVR